MSERGKGGGIALALRAIDSLIAMTAQEANRLAGSSSVFDEIGAGTGVGIRLKALGDAREAVVNLAVRDAEETGHAAP